MNRGYSRLAISPPGADATLDARLLELRRGSPDALRA
jgi:hypothetical protein